MSAWGNGTLSTVSPECEAEGSSAQGDATGGVKAQSDDLGPAVRSPGRRCWTDVGHYFYWPKEDETSRKVFLK